MLGLCSPSAHTTASARLLLPLPLGPMMTPTPGSKTSSVCLGNDLKPLRRSALRYTLSRPRRARRRSLERRRPAAASLGRLAGRGRAASPRSRARRAVRRARACSSCSASAAASCSARFLLVPKPCPSTSPSTHGLDLELAVVRRAAVAQDPVDDRLGRARQVLLQLGLVVDVAALGEADVLVEDLDDRRTHRLVAEGHVDRADERLGEVGEHVLVGLQLRQRRRPRRRGPACSRSILPRPSLRRHPGAGGAADDVGAQPRQVALGEVGEAPVQLGRDAQAEHAVAEELQALVRVDALGDPRRVREDLPQGRRVQLVRQCQQSVGHSSPHTATRGRLPRQEASPRRSHASTGPWPRRRPSSSRSRRRRRRS